MLHITETPRDFSKQVFWPSTSCTHSIAPISQSHCYFLKYNDIFIILEFSTYLDHASCTYAGFVFSWGFLGFSSSGSGRLLQVSALSTNWPPSATQNCLCFQQLEMFSQPLSNWSVQWVQTCGAVTKVLSGTTSNPTRIGRTVFAQFGSTQANPSLFVGGLLVHGEFNGVCHKNRETSCSKITMSWLDRGLLFEWTSTYLYRVDYVTDHYLPLPKRQT